MWEIFKQRRETEEFKEISEKAKESQKHNEHVHYLGPGGYVGRRSKWCADDPIASLNDSESVNPSILSSKRIGRSYDWIRARTKPQKGGGYYFPNEKTKEVFQKMNPTLCHLCVIHVEKGKVIVARGTVFPSNSQGDNLIHNNPIASHNVRVSVDDIVPEYQLTPLPVTCEEHETVGNAADSFVQWPKNLVMLGQDPISSEKEKDYEMSPKRIVQKPKKVESKGSVTPMKKTPIVGDDINSSEHCRSLRFLLNKRPSGKKDEVFQFEGKGEDPIYIGHNDVNEFLKMSCLSLPILEIFVKYAITLCNELKDETFAFMLPSRLAIPHIRDYQRQQEATEYLTDFLVANKERRLILAPYLQDNHWMLLLFCLYESVIYVFDPLKKERKIRLTTPARTAFKLYVPQGGLRNNRKDFLWCHTEVQCPQQEGGTECGYFVMRYMHDIIMLSQKNLDIDWKVGLGSRSYTRKEINEVRELWAKFFTVECL